MPATIQIGSSSAASQGTMNLTLDVQVTSNNDEGQPDWTPNAIANANSILNRSTVISTGSQQTITVPTGAAMVVIQPMATGVGPVVVSQMSGDTVNKINPKCPYMLVFDPANMPTSIFLNDTTAGEAFLLYWL